MFAKLKSYLGTVEGSIQGVINGAEMKRSGITSAVAGIAVAGSIQVLTIFASHAAAILPNPLLAFFAVQASTYFLDQLRRLGHSDPSSPATPPTVSASA